MLGLILVPLLGAVLAFGLRSLGKPLDRIARWILPVVTGVELLLAIRLARSFPQATEESGHLVAEIPFGLLQADGISLTPLLLTTALAFLAALASPSSHPRLLQGATLQMLALTGLVGVVLAFDLALFFAFWLLAAAALVALVRLYTSDEARRATVHLAAWLGVCGFAMLVAFVVLGRYGQSIALSELSDVGVDPGAQLFGLSLVKLVVSALFVAFVGMLAATSLSGSIVRGLADAPPAVGILAAGAFLPLGAYGLLRIAFDVLPAASAWAAPTMAVTGLLLAVVGAVRAMREDDFSRFALHAASTQLGLALLGLSALTPAGLQAGIVLIASHGLAVSMLLVLGRALSERVSTRNLDRFGGLAHAMPAYAAFAALAFATTAGAPGLFGFVGIAMSIGGAFPVYTVLSLLALLLFVGVGVVLARVFARLCFGAVPSAWQASPQLEPFGGKFPDLRRNEWLPLALAGAAVVVFGFWPRPVLRWLDLEATRLADELRPLGPMQIALEELWQRAVGLFS